MQNLKTINLMPDIPWSEIFAEFQLVVFQKKRFFIKHLL